MWGALKIQKLCVFRNFSQSPKNGHPKNWHPKKWALTSTLNRP